MKGKIAAVAHGYGNHFLKFGYSNSVMLRMGTKNLSSIHCVENNGCEMDFGSLQKQLSASQCDAGRAALVSVYINNRRMLRRLKVAFVKQMWQAVSQAPAPVFFKWC